MKTPFLLCVILRDQSGVPNVRKSSRMWNHPAYQAFSRAGYNQFPARAKRHKRGQSNPNPANRRHMRPACAAESTKILPGMGGIVNEGETNENGRHEGASVTKPTKPRNPSIKMGGVDIFETPGMRREPGSPGPSKEIIGGRCAKKPASKSAIADEIGLHLRSVYDDVLRQPVPGRFLELLRQLESASHSRLSKDGM
jgi:anti-sigma factor NepR-like protein